MDSIGDRMKAYYENRTRYYLPRRTFSIIRLDGRCFHNFTKNFGKPFDFNFMGLMDKTATHLCENIQGAKIAFVQSDEISIILTDFDELSTEAWFDGNIQKITSVSASIATAYFNSLTDPSQGLATFDSRVFTISDIEEVCNYLIWRQQDATRNSIQMVAQSFYSHRELMNKNTSVLQEMIFQKGINWNDYPVGCKRGRSVIRESYEVMGEEFCTVRHKWSVKEPPIFTEDRLYIKNSLTPFLS